MAKPGRNDPCPCGSGKKYKKCCLTNDEAAENERLVAERAEREERAAAKRQELRKVREAITANFAASDLLDDDFGDELMDASNRVVDLIRAGKLDEAEAAAREHDQRLQLGDRRQHLRGGLRRFTNLTVWGRFETSTSQPSCP